MTRKADLVSYLALLISSIACPAYAMTNVGESVTVPQGEEIVLSDGTKILVDGTIVRPDGTRILPTGDVVLPNGTVIQAQTS